MVALKIELVGGEGFDPIEVTVKDLGSGAETTRVSDPDRSSAAATSRTASWAFDVAGTPDLEIAILVPRPKWARGKPKPGQSGAWSPDETERITATLRATASGYTSATGVLHPRLSLVTGTVPGSTRAVPRVLVDLTFLPVTPYVTTADRLDIGVDRVPTVNGRENDRSIGALDPAHNPNPAQAPWDPARPADTGFVLYELTTAPRPRLWGVTVPKGVSLSAAYHMLLFCLPGNTAYRDGADASFLSLKRYLLSPPREVPFYVFSGGNPLRSAAVVNLDTPVVPTPPPGHPLADEFQFISDVTPCGFMEQVERSGKNVALVVPIPHDAPNLGKLTSTKGELRRLLQKLRVALAALLLPPMPPVPISETRVAVGGFSLGAGHAYQVVGTNPEGVNELYWFDPDPPDATQRAFLGQWLAGDPARVLRLVGGKNHGVLLELAEQLKSAAGDPSHLSVIPPVGFWHDSPLYEAAVSVPPGVPGWQKPKFDANPPATPGGLSEKVGIFVSALPEPSKIAFAVQNATGGEPSPIARKEGIAMADLVSFALFRVRRGPGNADAFVAAVRPAIKSYRHQWAVAGGNGGGAAMGRGSGFVGHLEDCLRRGLLP